MLDTFQTVTYNLHIMLRFELELGMLAGKLAVRDLPQAWNAKNEEYLGLIPPDDRDGVLQDVHWTMNIGGGFQGYTFGNVLSAQFYEAAIVTHPDIPMEISNGKFDTLHEWLRDKIYQNGPKYSLHELVERITGGPLQVEPYFRYLKQKFGELYSL